MSPSSAQEIQVDRKPIEHIERKYTSAGTNYLLPSDDGERKRLALQHGILKRAFAGQLILPEIDFSQGGRILDSGTGSGTWILDAAQILPSSVHLHGVDIEPGLFPEKPDLASDSELSLLHKNIHFSVESITKFPIDWENKYTFVHQRFLISALQAAEWPTAINEIHRVLVPGGWVQFGESSEWRGGLATEKLKRFMQALYGSKGLLLDCVAHIPSMLKDAGFINIHVEKRAIPLGKWAGKDGCDGRDNFVEVFRGMKTPLLKAGGLGYATSEEEFDKFMDDLGKEWDETPGSEVDFVGIYARKPVGE